MWANSGTPIWWQERNILATTSVNSLLGKVLTLEEVAEHWKVTTQVIEGLIASGHLKAIKFAGQLRITESALNEYIAKENGPIRQRGPAGLQH